MPKRYTAIRDRLESRGVPVKAAKTSAAKIFNATRPAGAAPVTGKESRGVPKKWA